MTASDWVWLAISHCFCLVFAYGRGWSTGFNDASAIWEPHTKKILDVIRRTTVSKK